VVLNDHHISGPFLIGSCGWEVIVKHELLLHSVFVLLPSEIGRWLQSLIDEPSSLFLRKS
jgi:hypothetical protein